MGGLREESPILRSYSHACVYIIIKDLLIIF